MLWPPCRRSPTPPSSTPSAAGAISRRSSIRSGGCPRRPPRARRSTAPRPSAARAVYCGPIGVEFMHIADPERARVARASGWRRRRRAPDRRRILERLLARRALRADPPVALHRHQALLDRGRGGAGPAARRGARRPPPSTAPSMAVLAMSHRGRLNVMATRRRQGRRPRSSPASRTSIRAACSGGGDVKYHLGATGDVHAPPTAARSRIHLASNPSHLEAVDPVAMGRVRAKQVRARRRGRRATRAAADAARRRRLRRPGHRRRDAQPRRRSPASRSAARVHVVVNNLIGFTTEPRALQLVALRDRRRPAAADPDLPRQRRGPRRGGARRRASRSSTAPRSRSDVVVDLVGYRRYGHSEVDDPTITQPRPLPPDQAACRRSGRATPSGSAPSRRARRGARAAGYRQSSTRRKRGRASSRRRRCCASCPATGRRTAAAAASPALEVDTGVAAARARAPRRTPSTATPEGFHVHPKVEKLLERAPARWARGEQAARLRHGRGARLRLAARRSGMPVRLVRPGHAGAAPSTSATRC